MSIFSDFNNDVKKKFKKVDVLFDNEASVEPIGTGSTVIDSTIGGIAYLNRITEISSYESGGKTTLALLTVAQALRKYPDKGVIYIDSELALDKNYMKKLGADPDDERLMIYQPNNIEEAESILFSAFEPVKGKSPKLHKMVSLLVIDSVSTLRSKQEFTDELGESSQKGQHATAWGKFIMKINMWSKNNGMAVLLINQFRAKPQISNMDKFSLSNNGIGQGYSNTDTSITTCVTYDTTVRVRVNGKESIMTMAELEKLCEQNNSVMDMR